MVAIATVTASFDVLAHVTVGAVFGKTPCTEYSWDELDDPGLPRVTMVEGGVDMASCSAGLSVDAEDAFVSGDGIAVASAAVFKEEIVVMKGIAACLRDIYLNDLHNGMHGKNFMLFEEEMKSLSRLRFT